MTEFDLSLDNALEWISNNLRGVVEEVTVVRDLVGKISVVVPDVDAAREHVSVWATTVHELLGRYSFGKDEAVVLDSALVDREDVVESKDRVLVDDTHLRVYLLERLVTNHDWVREPLISPSPLPLLTFFSIKGGVGRTTALAACAWHLARLGRNVVAVDLDLEAPGLGHLLLDQEPDYGLIDLFTSELIPGGTDVTLEGCLGTAGIAGDSPGTIRVLPARGRESKNYIAKLGRVFAPTVGDEGRIFVFADRLSKLVHDLSNLVPPPDAVLIDARAGLQDIGSAAVTQIEAEVFLFLRNEAQSFEAYSDLFDRLRLSRAIKYSAPEGDLRLRLKTVAAMAGASEAERDSFIRECFDLWLIMYDETTGNEGNSFSPAVLDPQAPHFPVPITYEPGVRALRFNSAAERPTWDAVWTIFKDVCTEAEARLFGG